MLLAEFLHVRTDRLIATGRVAIAVFALGAVWIEPSQPAAPPELTYGLLAAYLAFAAAVLLAARLEVLRASGIALASHLVDLAVFSAMMFLTEGPASPFFLVFTFSLVSATLRWSWKGALWTATAIILLLIVIAATFRLLVPELPFELDRFIMRCAHILVIGAMLVYVGFRFQRITEEATRLAAWQPDPARAGDLPSLLELSLAHVANVLDAPRTVMVLSDADEPWPTVSLWHDGTFRHERLMSEVDTVVAAPLAGSTFIISPSGSALVSRHEGPLQPWHGTPFGPALAGYDLNRALAVPIACDRATGWLFAADRPDFAQEHLVLARLLAAQIAVGLDRLAVIEAAMQAAAAEERLSLARDLHDGVLQTLAGTALQLQTVRLLTERDPDAARAKIYDIQAWLLHEQREMRGFIAKLRPGRSAPSVRAEEPPDLPALATALEKQWGAKIQLADEAASLVVPAEMQFHARQIIREAVANAVRHGEADEISLQVKLDDSGLSMTIADNGKGLPIHGRFDQGQCAQDRIGPRSLRERIIGLGGSLRVDSAPTGLTLSINLPLRSMNAAADDRSDRR